MCRLAAQERQVARSQHGRVYECFFGYKVEQPSLYGLSLLNAALLLVGIVALAMIACSVFFPAVTAQ
jgi:hypothetical protein